MTEVNRVADELTDGDEANGEADVLILLVHEGAETPDIASATDDSRFGKIVNGVDPEHPDDHLGPHAPRVRPRDPDRRDRATPAW